jgi:metal-responsive CopG/Arc/MetJ family transcriptional regulator
MRVKTKQRQNGFIRTTLSLPADLLDAADQMVASGQAASRNDFIAEAIRHELGIRRRAAIDEAFAGMRVDTEAHQEAARLQGEFAVSDWQAFQQGEQ